VNTEFWYVLCSLGETPQYYVALLSACFLLVTCLALKIEAICPPKMPVYFYQIQSITPQSTLRQHRGSRPTQAYLFLQDASVLLPHYKASHPSHHCHSLEANTDLLIFTRCQKITDDTKLYDEYAYIMYTGLCCFQVYHKKLKGRLCLGFLTCQIYRHDGNKSYFIFKSKNLISSK
jgi:hypothetical protein